MENNSIAEVEKLYSPSLWCYHRCSPELVVQKHVETVTKESVNVKKKLLCQANVRYGPGPRQLLDIFEPVACTSAPTFVYIHGGYWQDLNKDISCYCVKSLTNAGVRVIIPGYDLAPSVSLNTIVEEIKELAKFLSEQRTIRQWSSPFWLGGHSAGAHLASVILCTSLHKHVAGFILISGIYDLRPLVNTTINDALKLNYLNAEKLSPILNLSELQTDSFSGLVLMVTGEFDSPAFHEQQKFFAKELRQIGVRVEEKTISKVDHFTVVECLSEVNYALTKIIINVIYSETKIFNSPCI